MVGSGVTSEVLGVVLVVHELVISGSGNQRNVGEGRLHHVTNRVPDLRVTIGVRDVTGQKCDVRFEGCDGLDRNATHSGKTHVGEKSYLEWVSALGHL